MAKEAWQLNMFGPPEKVDTDMPTRGRMDAKPVPWERENLWPSVLIRTLGDTLLDEFYGDIPRVTRLQVRQVCRRLNCDSNLVYSHIDTGLLDGTDIAQGASKLRELRVYRYSLVNFFFSREFVAARTRTVERQHMDKVELAVKAWKNAYLKPL